MCNSLIFIHKVNKNEEPIFTGETFINYTVNKIEQNKQNTYYIFWIVEEKVIFHPIFLQFGGQTSPLCLYNVIIKWSFVWLLIRIDKKEKEKELFYSKIAWINQSIYTPNKWQNLMHFNNLRSFKYQMVELCGFFFYIKGWRYFV